MSTATILWLSCSWTPLLIWWTLRNSARFKKNIVVGVTFPREAREDMQVKALLTSYRRLQLACAIVLVAAALGGAATGTVRAWAGSSMFCWSVWILVVCIVPEVIYALTNRRLAALKDERGWRPRGAAAQRVTVADIGAAAQSYPRVSSIWFALICAASLVPVLLDRDNVVIYLLFAACVLMMWAIFRWCYRNRSEVVDDNTALTQTLIPRRQPRLHGRHVNSILTLQKKTIHPSRLPLAIQTSRCLQIQNHTIILTQPNLSIANILQTINPFRSGRNNSTQNPWPIELQESPPLIAVVTRQLDALIAGIVQSLPQWHHEFTRVTPQNNPLVQR